MRVDAKVELNGLLRTGPAVDYCSAAQPDLTVGVHPSGHFIVQTQRDIAIRRHPPATGRARRIRTCLGNRFHAENRAIGNDQISVATQQLFVLAITAELAGVEQQNALAVSLFEDRFHGRLERLIQLQRLGGLHHSCIFARNDVPK